MRSQRQSPRGVRAEVREQIRRATKRGPVSSPQTLPLVAVIHADHLPSGFFELEIFDSHRGLGELGVVSIDPVLHSEEDHDD